MNLDPARVTKLYVDAVCTEWDAQQWAHEMGGTLDFVEDEWHRENPQAWRTGPDILDGVELIQITPTFAAYEAAEILDAWWHYQDHNCQVAANFLDHHVLDEVIGLLCDALNKAGSDGSSFNHDDEDGECPV